MDCGSLIGFVLLLSIATLVLHLIWFWIVALVLRGAPAYIGIVAGWHVGSSLDSGALGLFVAVLVTGLLSMGVSLGLRACERAR
ncbi:MAG: hypothetical protein ACT4OF_15850 [Caulobacteraceae bacterium]